MTQVEVNHDATRRRLTAAVDGEIAELDYTLAAGVMTITHTGVPRPIEGRGIAGALMHRALEIARERGWRVVPACSYAAAYLEKHPDESGAATPDAATPNQVGRSPAQHESDLLDEALDESFPASDPPAVGHSS
jgi:uncharacterized protein